MIDRHISKATSAGVSMLLSSSNRRMLDTIPKIQLNPHNIELGSVFSDYLRSISYCEFNKLDKEYTYQFLFFANQIAKAHFALVINDGRPIRVEIGRKIIETTGKFTRNFIGVDVLEDALYVALIMRDKQAIDLYVSVPFRITEKSTTSHDEYSETFMAFLQSIFDPNAFHLDALDRALKFASGDRYVSIYRRPFVDNLYVPALRVYEALFKDDQALFDQRLIEALELHKKFFGDEERSVQAPGLISFKLTAACALAYDNGLKINVQSDYLPVWMIEGKHRNIELIVS